MSSTRTTWARWLQLATLLLVLAFSAGCELVGQVFEAGVWVGVIVVLVVVGIVGFLISKMRSS